MVYLSVDKKDLDKKHGYTGFYDDIWDSLLHFQICRSNVPYFFTRKKSGAH